MGIKKQIHIIFIEADTIYIIIAPKNTSKYRKETKIGQKKFFFAKTGN